MDISAKDVKRLRDVTGVGMMDCKKALAEANGDFDQAIDLLRKKGQKVAAKRADREAKEGLIVTAVSSDGKRGAIAEVNCETDFVARNDEFSAFVEKLGRFILDQRPADLDTLKAMPFENGMTVQERVTELTGKIGEKIDVRRFAIVATEDGQVISYIHPGSRLGVAMQVAALNPVATTRDEVPEEIKEKELEIGREAARNEGKPDHIIDRIAQGKLERYYKDNVLVEQPFVKDASTTVQEMLKQADVSVKRFVRYALGD
jgi:elongation factor Ts